MNVFQMRARIGEEQIRRLVDRFYAAVRQDPLLGPVFAAQIAEGEWPAHLDKLQAFWSTALLGSGRYRRDPVAAHRALPELRPDHFARWLELFDQATREVFPADVAAAVHGRAARMGRHLESVAVGRPAG